jgi:hypothetical protein
LNYYFFTLEIVENMRFERFPRFINSGIIGKRYHAPPRRWRKVECGYESEFYLSERLICVLIHKSPRKNGGKW